MLATKGEGRLLSAKGEIALRGRLATKDKGRLLPAKGEIALRGDVRKGTGEMNPCTGPERIDTEKKGQS